MIGLSLAGANWVQPLIVQILAFALLLAVLIKFVVPVLRRILQERRNTVGQHFENLEREMREVSQQMAHMRQNIAGIEKEAQIRLDAAVQEGTRMRDQALAEANAQAASELAKARRDVQIERDKAVMELRAEVARLTFEITEKTIDQTIDENVHGRLVDRYLTDIEEAARRQ